jgi:hypothetical protein
MRNAYRRISLRRMVLGILILGSLSAGEDKVSQEMREKREGELASIVETPYAHHPDYSMCAGKLELVMGMKNACSVLTVNRW